MAALDVRCFNIPLMVVMQLDIVIKSSLSGNIMKPASNKILLEKVVHLWTDNNGH
jgi:hypothetical protein